MTLFCKLHILPYISTVLMGVLNLGASLVTIFLVEKVFLSESDVHAIISLNIIVDRTQDVATCGISLHAVYFAGICDLDHLLSN